MYRQIRAKNTGYIRSYIATLGQFLTSVSTALVFITPYFNLIKMTGGISLFAWYLATKESLLKTDALR